MYYLADFEWQQISTGYYNALDTNKELRNRLTKGNWRDTFINPKKSKGRMKRVLNKTDKILPNSEKTARSGKLIETLLKDKESGYTGLAKANEILDKEPFTGIIGNKKYLKDKQIREDINKKLVGLPASEKNKILGMIQDGKVVSPPPKVVEKKVEKILTQPPSTNPPTTVTTNKGLGGFADSVSKEGFLGNDAPKVANKVKPNRLGLKVLGATALAGGALYGLNKLRKSRSDKGKTRGAYKR